jgi:hypothetical protein
MPKKRGPKSGESVGGVCPEEVLFAIRRLKRVSRRMIITWRVGINGGKNCVAKWVEGYPSPGRIKLSTTPYAKENK